MIRRGLRLPITPQGMKNGEQLASPYFLLKYKANGLPHHRFAAIVSARAGKTAVIRHIIKRELLRTVAAWPLVKNGMGGRAYDMLFIASPRLASVQKKDIPPTLRTEIKKISLKLF